MKTAKIIVSATVLACTYGVELGEPKTLDKVELIEESKTRGRARGGSG